MTARESDSERAARAIEKAVHALPDRERAHVVRFLLRSWLDIRFGWMQPPGALERVARQTVPASIGVTGAFTSMPVVAPGTEHQTFVCRLPDEQHARLKSWCAEHGFSMATVVRGLVENFLNSQPGAA
jgi:hypothetical protein